ncbi:MAG: MFS transporter [Chloroflexi bacterium]|nr:MFS transporter [Chloroflexota bacterium]
MFHHKLYDLKRDGQPPAGELIVRDPKKEFWIITVIAISALMMFVDSTITNVALPSITEYFHTSTGMSSRVILVYLLATAVFMLPFGKLGDIKGYKAVFITGFILFTAASLFCGLAKTLNQLVFFRTLQGMGGAMLFALGVPVISAYMPANKQGFYIGILVSISGIGVALGPPVGGFLTSYLSWRWIYLVNVPIGIIAVIISLIVIPSGMPCCKDRRLDIVGTLLTLITLTSLLYGLNMGQEYGWTSALTFSFFVIFFAGLVFLIYWEQRVPYPLFDLESFKNINFTFAMLAGLLFFLIYSGLIFIMPFYLEMFRGFDVRISGLVLTSLAAGQVFLGPYAGKLSDRMGARLFCVPALILTSLSFVMLMMMQDTSHFLYIIAALLLFSIGIGIFLSPNINIVMSYAPEDKKGEISGLMMTIRRAGMALGLCLFETVFSEALPPGVSGLCGDLSPIKQNMNLLNNAFHYVFFFGLMVSILALLFSIVATEKKNGKN